MGWYHSVKRKGLGQLWLEIAGGKGCEWGVELIYAERDAEWDAGENASFHKDANSAHEPLICHTQTVHEKQNLRIINIGGKCVTFTREGSIGSWCPLAINEKNRTGN